MFFARSFSMLLIGIILIIQACKKEDTLQERQITFNVQFSVGPGQRVSIENIVEAVDSGYVVSGAISNTDFPVQKLFVAKISPRGKVEQMLTEFGIPGNITGGSLVKTSDNAYVLAGERMDPIEGVDFVAIKLNSNLSVAWQKVYHESPRFEYSKAIVETADGHVVIAGDAVPPGYDPFFIKINPLNGEKVKGKLVELPGDGSYRIIHATSSGNTIGLIGIDIGGVLKGYYFMKIDHNLNPVVTHTPLDHPSVKIAADNAGGFVIAGNVTVPGSSLAYLSGVSAFGDNPRWLDVFPNALSSSFLGLSKNSSGQFISCGWVKNDGSFYTAAAALVSGGLEVEQTFLLDDAFKNSAFAASVPSGDGGAVLAGYVNNDSKNEVLVVKLNDKFRLD